MRAIIVDDEPHAIERLRIMCGRCDDVAIVGCATNAVDALELIHTMRPDVMLLDISMPGTSGIGLVRRLAGATETSPAIIFVTAHERYAIEAFDLAVADYLLKPVTKDRLRRAFQRASDRQGRCGSDTISEDTFWWVPSGSELVRLSEGEIDWVQAERDYVRIHARARSYLLRETMSAVESRLPADAFLRVHRSALVRRDRITGIARTGSGWQIIVRNVGVVPIGRTYFARVKASAGFELGSLDNNGNTTSRACRLASPSAR